MNTMEGYWEATNGHAPHPVKYESEASVPGYSYCNEQLNFSTTNTTYSEDDGDFAPGRRGKTSRQDPLSHRIIEKRRRDRMNSCLADLSRLIPQQYMRKGRGRVEKTEIIEMAIRHLKNLQNQECVRESSCAEQYRLGYNDCLTEAAKFMLRERGEEMCYRMVAHLKEHCSEIMKGEMIKSRCGSDMQNGGSPVYLHHPGPLSQLREMLSCPSDIEHSSNDHHDVKDLSFRSASSSVASAANNNSNNSNNNPPQAPVITSTAPNSNSSSVQHLDTSSNHSAADFEASSPSRISTSSTTNGSSSAHHLHHQDTNNNINAQHESVLRTIRMRKFSENSPEHEHSHNSYKFKNYIQQRFSQDVHGHHLENGHHDLMAHSPSSAHGDDHPMAEMPSAAAPVPPPPPATPCKVSGGPKSDEPLSLKRKASSLDQHQPLAIRGDVEDSKMAAAEIKSEHLAPNSRAIAASAYGSYPVPIFACHTQGFYIPLNVAYETLLPYLNGVDLFGATSKGSGAFPRQMPPLHPISISVNYAPMASSANSLVVVKNGLTTPNGSSKPSATLVEAMVNGC